MQILKQVKYKMPGMCPNFWWTDHNHFVLVTSFSSTIGLWCNDPQTKKGHLDCKGRSVTAALKEFKDLYQVKEFFVTYHPQTKFWKDDSIEIFYRN